MHPYICLPHAVFILSAPPYAFTLTHLALPFAFTAPPSCHLQTIVMCIEHHPAPHVAPGNPFTLTGSNETFAIEAREKEDLVCVLETINAAFTFGFLLEMILKVTALGAREYVSDAFNVRLWHINGYGILRL